MEGRKKRGCSPLAISLKKIPSCSFLDCGGVKEHPPLVARSPGITGAYHGYRQHWLDYPTLHSEPKTSQSWITFMVGCCCRGRCCHRHYCLFSGPQATGAGPCQPKGWGSNRSLCCCHGPLPEQGRWSCPDAALQDRRGSCGGRRELRTSTHLSPVLLIFLYSWDLLCSESTNEHALLCEVGPED